MAETSIEWTEKSWNPVRGCALVSEGCRSCYAMGQAHRFAGKGKPYEGLTVLGKHGPRWTGEARFVREMLDVPITWRKPCRVFVNSMSDLFHDDIAFEEIAAVFGVMAGTPQHTYQVLTKRPERMVEFFRWVASDPDVPEVHVVETCAANLCDVDQLFPPWPLPNVHIGVSVENQEAADERIPLLLQAPAAVRWLSCEPLLGRVCLSDLVVGSNILKPLAGLRWVPRADGVSCSPESMSKIDWVVVGGEAGPGSRPMDLAWARNIVSDCQASGTPVFVKQMGAVWAKENHSKHVKGGLINEWPIDLRVRQWPEVR